MLDFSNFDTLTAVIDFFTTETVCKTFLAEQRWGKTVVCPHCGSVHCYQRKDGRYICADCDKSFSVTVGTIFESSHIALRKWFIAMYLVSSHKKGISSCQLARDIKTTQKTAWYMLQKIRTLYKQDRGTVLDGEVEMDEMYLGGKERWKHADKKTPHAQGRSTKVKTPIFGMIERDGNAVIMRVSDTKASSLMPIIKEYVTKSARIFTDEGQMYWGLRRSGYQHSNCDHGHGQYVSECGASTNCVEGFWSHFHRSMYGIYHQCNVKYLQRYIDEQTFRWNSRKMTEGQRFEMMLAKAASVVSYKTVKVKDIITVSPIPQPYYDAVMRSFVQFALKEA